MPVRRISCLRNAMTQRNAIMDTPPKRKKKEKKRPPSARSGRQREKKNGCPASASLPPGNRFFLPLSPSAPGCLFFFGSQANTPKVNSGGPKKKQSPGVLRCLLCYGGSTLFFSPPLAFSPPHAFRALAPSARCGEGALRGLIAGARRGGGKTGGEKKKRGATYAEQSPPKRRGATCGLSSLKV